MCPQDVLEVKERAEKSKIVYPELTEASQSVVWEADLLVKKY